MAFPGPISWGLAIRALGYLTLGGLIAFFVRLYQTRTMMRRYQKQYDIPMLPHSFLLGHLGVVAKVAMQYPRDMHGQGIPLAILKKYPEYLKNGAIYMDVWPIGYPMLAVFDPNMMAQFTQDQSQLKHPGLRVEMGPFTGAKDLVSTEGQEWKMWRSIFNPGFSAKNLQSLVPQFLEEALVFCDTLRKFATSGEVIPHLEDHTTAATVDMIGRAVFGTRLHSQTAPIRMMDAMVGQVKLLWFDLQLQKILNPLRPLKHWYYNRTFRNEVMPYIQNTVRNYEKIEGPKTILNLALKAYVNEVQDVSQRGNIPADFLEIVVAQIKIFLFAGHDTTATTLCYMYHLLSTNPEKDAKLRAEHDEVFGTDPSQAAAKIRENPNILNLLPYTNGVIKETLRLYPVVGTVRDGAKGYFLTNPQGAKYPTEGIMLFGCSQAGHRNPLFWPEPDSFLPERWIAAPEDPLHPAKNAFRPWELGPRNCIGQELAQVELRLIMALTAREFVVKSCYDEEGFADGKSVDGDLAYQVQTSDMITAHPNRGMPARVSFRK